MRLLHVEGDPWGDDPLNISLCEKLGDDIPRYMILSHRWREDEVLFSDITNADPTVPRSKKGWEKLEASCRIALQMGLNYVWNDTCCIDKSSSAELSEAINSMYQFYAKSDICFAYLDDVDDHAKHEAIEASIWFTRAWTLQELIAPKELYLYSKGWKNLGSKQSLCDLLTDASHVPKKVLLDPSCLVDFSVAEKMHWAAWREATREEDEAYSLMGIFDVNFSPLYGEGRTRAFRRLQIEIMQQSHDHTIFAWNRRMATGDMLAKSPRDFLSQHTYRRMKIETYVDIFALQKAKLDYNMSNIGLHIELPVLAVPGKENLFFAFIACRSNREGSFVAICLARSTSGRFTRWFRTAWRNCTLFHFPDLFRLQFEPRELWVSALSRQDDYLSSQSLSRSVPAEYQFPVHIWYPTETWAVYWSSGLQQTTSSIKAQKDHPSSWILVQRQSSVQVIMFYSFAMRIGSAGFRAGLCLAIGELNDRIWILPYMVSSIMSSEVFDGFQKASARLQKECAFPNGIAWRESRRDFAFLEPSYDKMPFLPPDPLNLSDVSRLCSGSWHPSLPYRWACQMNASSGAQELMINMYA